MNNKRIVITGVSGFVGKHLTHQLTKKGHTVIGVGISEDIDPEIGSLLESYIQQDIGTSWPEINDVDAIINLAALAVVGASFEQPQEYISVNSSIVTNMCEFYLKQNKKPRIISISSGTVYSPFQKMPLKEDSKITFSSPYVISKILNENQLSYYRSRGLDCISVRPFNHIGPGQLSGFLIPDLLDKLANVKRKKIDYIETGNVKTRRDYTDVRDVVRAYSLLAEAEILNYETYNICSGKSYSGEEILQLLKEITDTQNISHKINLNNIRPNDPKDIYGDYQRIYKDTNWKPAITLEKTLKDCVDSFNVWGSRPEPSQYPLHGIVGSD